MQKRKLLFSVVYAAFVMNGALVSADLSTDTTDSSSTVEVNARRDNGIVLPVSNLKSESIDLSQQKVSAKNKLLLSLGVLMLVFGPGLIGFATPLAIAFGVFCCFIGIILSSIGGIGVRKDYALVSAVSKASVVTGKSACAGVYTDQKMSTAGGSPLQALDASVKTEDSASKAVSEESQDTHEASTDQTMPPAGGSPLQALDASVKTEDSASKAVSEESQDTHEALTDHTTPPAGGSMLQESGVSVDPAKHRSADAVIRNPQRGVWEEWKEGDWIANGHKNIIELLQGEVIKVDDGAQGNVAVPVQVQLDESKKHGQTQNGGDHSRRGLRIVRPIMPVMLSQLKIMDKNSSELKSGVGNDMAENASGSKPGVGNDMAENASGSKSGVDNDMGENASGVDNDDDKNLDAGQMEGDNVPAVASVDHSATPIEEQSCEVPNAQELMREIACALCENVPSSEPAVGHSATNDEQSATEDEQKKLLNRLTKSNATQEKEAMAELIYDLSQSTPKYKHLLQRVLNILRNPPQSASKDKNWLLNILRNPKCGFDHLCKKLRSILGINPSSRHTILSLAISNRDLCLVQGIVEALGQECLSEKCYLQEQGYQKKEYHVLELLCRNMYGRRSHQKKELISEKCILAYLLMNMAREENVELIKSLIKLYSNEQKIALYSRKRQLDPELHKQNAIYISKVLSIFNDATDHMGWIGMILAAVCEHLSTSSTKNTAALATILKLLNKSDPKHIAYVKDLCHKYAESEYICKILNAFLSHNINSQSVTRPKKRNG